MTVISVIVGSTRECRFSEKPAKWVLQHLKKRRGVDARLLDQLAQNSITEKSGVAPSVPASTKPR
jgi:NAD(P)H-dependent FMN reductase